MAKKRITKSYAVLLDKIAKEQAKGVDPVSILTMLSAVIAVLKFLGIDVSTIIDALRSRNLPIPPDLAA